MENTRITSWVNKKGEKREAFNMRRTFVKKDGRYFADGIKN